MKLYGVGILMAPGTNRVVHDFVDGPFETTNPVLIEYARAQGCTLEPPKLKVTVDKPIKVSTTKPVVEKPKPVFKEASK